MRPRPARLARLPEQYFTALLARVAAAAAADGDPVIDLGRGNPEVGPPAHVVTALSEAARDPRAHGYPPFLGLAALRRAIAERYRSHYGVELDPDREIAVFPGTKTALVELALVTADRGSSILLPDPGYPDYPSGVALAGARLGRLELVADAGWSPDFDTADPHACAAVYLNYPSNPCGVVVRPGVFANAVRFAERTGAVIVHDFAYGDLVFDGRRPESFLATPGAKEVGVEMYSLSKTYGMAGWRLGFVVGNEEVVARANLLQDHARAGIFLPLQEAGIAALTGPQESVTERVSRYERRRDLVFEALAGTRMAPPRAEGTFFVWLQLPDGVTADSLLEEHRVALAPGEGFGLNGVGWARLSLAVTDEVLAAGLERLRRALV
jgi:L-glutamine---4-(methylsulfanyl)-2-oxobutanoate aminotransferase